MCKIVLKFKAQIKILIYLRTRGGKIFSAALRGTENPPWVLVSLAVRVLQKNSTGCLLCLRPRSDASNASLSYCKMVIVHALPYKYLYMITLPKNDGYVFN